MSGGAVGATGGSGALSVSTGAECTWTAAADQSWITDLHPASGQGTTQIEFAVGANPDPVARQANIKVNGQSASVRQDAAPCRFGLSATSQSIGAAGGTLTVSVTATNPCAWTASSSADWVTIASGASGTANGTVRLQVGSNGGDARTGSVTIAGQTFTVAQAAATAAACTYSLTAPGQQVPPSGGSGAVAVQTTTTCSWTAVSSEPWITVTSATTGMGGSTVTFAVAANTGSAPRSGTVMIANQAFTVTQESSGPACTYTVNPISQSVGAGGGAGAPVSVTSGAGCGWTATSNDEWLTIASGANGSGNGTVTFTAQANTAGARTGTLTIAGRTFTVTQAQAQVQTCSYNINPGSQSVAAGGGTGTAVSVTSGSGCSWTAASNDEWLTITSGASGSGNGTVRFTVQANTGSGRTGTLTIAGRTFTVTQAQAPACSYNISPNNQSVGAGGGNGAPVSVTSGAGCSWTATSNVQWLAIASGASGSGNGTVTFTAQANTGGSRNGTLTIAGRTFTVTQAQAPSCSYTINPSEHNFESNGGTGTVAVSTVAGCTWSATSNDSWITVTAGASGTGNGTVSYRVTANDDKKRDGTLTIAGRNFKISQAKN